MEEAQGRQEKVQQERERLERAATCYRSWPFSCNSQRVATSMLTTDISLPVLGHILDIIGIYIGLYHWFVVLPVFCSQLAELVLSNTTGNNHPRNSHVPMENWSQQPRV